MEAANLTRQCQQENRHTTESLRRRMSSARKYAQSHLELNGGLWRWGSSPSRIRSDRRDSRPRWCKSDCNRFICTKFKDPDQKSRCANKPATALLARGIIVRGSSEVLIRWSRRESWARQAHIRPRRVRIRVSCRVALMWTFSTSGQSSQSRAHMSFQISCKT